MLGSDIKTGPITKRKQRDVMIERNCSRINNPKLFVRSIVMRIEPFRKTYDIGCARTGMIFIADANTKCSSVIHCGRK